MSNFVQYNVFERFPPQKISLKAALNTLAFFADDTGYCFPSQAKIAHYSGMSLSSAKRALHELAKMEEIRMKTVGSGRSLHCLYYLDKYAATEDQLNRREARKSSHQNRFCSVTVRPQAEPSVNLGVPKQDLCSVKHDGLQCQAEPLLVSNSKEELASGILSVALNFKFGDQHSKERRREMYQVLIKHEAVPTSFEPESLLDLVTSEFEYEDAYVCAYLDTIHMIGRKDQPPEFQNIVSAIFRRDWDALSAA